MRSLSKILWGFVLIGIGIIIGLNSLEITNINLFFNGWWTLFIIVPCLIGLFDNENSKTGNVIGLLIGIALLCGTRNIFPIEWIAKLIFPTILIFIGLSFIFKSKFEKNISDKFKKETKNGLENIIATFSEQKVNKEKEHFKGANLDAVFGGVTLDLRDADLEEETLIEANSIFGGITIIVPKDVNVKVKSTSIFGGVSNKIKNKEDNKKVIYISCVCLFGGLDIK